MEKTLLINDFLLVDKVTYGAKTPNQVTLPFFAKTIALPSFDLPQMRKVQAGDVVVFRENDRFNNKLLVKRCIAIGGQRVEIREKRVMVDGEMIDSLLALATGENPANNQDSSTLPIDFIEENVKLQGGINRDNFGPLTIPVGTIFVLGDNRDFSFDSRYFGVVDLKAVVGRAILIYYSAADSTESGMNNINWTRLGRFIR